MCLLTNTILSSALLEMLNIENRKRQETVLRSRQSRSCTVRAAPIALCRPAATSPTALANHAAPGRARRVLGTRRSRRNPKPHPSRRDKCNFYFRLRTRPSRLVSSTLFSVGVHAPFKCRSSIISPRPTFCPANDRHLRSAVLYHPRDLFCLSYVHPESQHIR